MGISPIVLPGKGGSNMGVYLDLVHGNASDDNHAEPLKEANSCYAKVLLDLLRAYEALSRDPSPPSIPYVSTRLNLWFTLHFLRSRAPLKDDKFRGDISGRSGTPHKVATLRTWRSRTLWMLFINTYSTTLLRRGCQSSREMVSFLLPVVPRLCSMFTGHPQQFIPQRHYVPSQGSSMRESGDIELIFFTMQGGTFISASDALAERFSGLLQGEETMLHGCSSTISLRIEVIIVYNLQDPSVSLNACAVARVWTVDGSGKTAI